MSLEELLAEGDITVKRPTRGKDASGGKVHSGLKTIFTGGGRVRLMSTSEIEAWGRKGYQVDSELQSLEPGFEQNDMVTDNDDGRLFRIEAKGTRKGMGSLETYYLYQMKEIV